VAPTRVIAHRGASAACPEHTRGAFVAALDQGADVLEVDIVSTADGVLVARHDWALSRTTDVAAHPELADLRRERQGLHGRLSDWWVDSMTWRQVRTLRARERWPFVRPGSAALDGRWPVMTLAEVLELADAQARSRGRGVGLAIELKDVQAARLRHGLDIVAMVRADLAAARLPRPGVPVWVMAFEPEPLERLRAAAGGEVPRTGLVQLVQDEAATSSTEWDAVAARCDVVGVALDLVLATAGADAGERLVRDAHRRNLGVWAWTFRAENEFLPVGLRRGSSPAACGDMGQQILEALELGVAGLIGDQPDLMRRLGSVGS
jgi:glycerophosphoryl diester phosphodiesterase